MSVNKVLADGIQPTVTTAVTLYTAPAAGKGTRVIAFTATNNSGTTDTYDLYIVPSAGTADATNKIINAKALTNPASDVPAQVLNHLIPAGGSLQVQVSTGTTISFRATGIEF